MSAENENKPVKIKKRYWQRIGGKFLVLSILAHVLFFAGAAYYVIQKISPKKLTFRAGAPSTNPIKKAAEHKVQMAKKQKSMAAPQPAKRVVSTAPTKMVLPEMPAMPTNVISPTQITGMGGVGTGFTGMGGNGNGDGGGGSGFISPFGTNTVRTGALVGTFYDLKHNRDRTDSKDMHYDQELQRFVNQKWNPSVFSKYLKGLHSLYATEIFFPTIDTNDAPKAFGSPLPDSPGRWVAVYRGKVSPPESGTYHFVAAGDDDMIIRFDNKDILFNCEHVNAPAGGTLKNAMGSDTLGDSIYHYQGQDAFSSFVRSLPITVEAGKYYDIAILIGDDTPAKMYAKILIEKEGTTYQMDGSSPILPVFGLDKIQAPAGDAPQHTSDGPLWKGKEASTSLLDSLQ